MGGETSPVYAPDGSWCMFWASTLISDSFNPSRAAVSAVNGGQIASSTPLPIGRRASSFRPKSRASAAVMCIFQLPAMYGRRASGVIQRLHSGELLSLQQLERRAASGGEVRHAIRQAERR